MHAITREWSAYVDWILAMEMAVEKYIEDAVCLLYECGKRFIIGDRQICVSNAEDS